jgi:hypothetical protein
MPKAIEKAWVPTQIFSNVQLLKYYKKINKQQT